MQLSQRQFKTFSDLVYSNCGIHLHAGKKHLLKARLAKRLRKTNIRSIDEYLQLVKSDGRELIRFLNAVSTNHTFFFREPRHFQYLHEGHRNIWCAASSSGEEPYSVAIYCLEKGFRPSILATDISTSVLQTGQSGIYHLSKTKNIPKRLLKKYFQRGRGKWEGFVRVKEELRRLVTFKRFNLLTDPSPSCQFDVIFCRNVLIYFDHAVKLRVVNKLYGALKKNGYFIIGGAESLSSLQHGYRYIEPSIYMKA